MQAYRSREDLDKYSVHTNVSGLRTPLFPEQKLEVKLDHFVYLIQGSLFSSFVCMFILSKKRQNQSLTMIMTAIPSLFLSYFLIQKDYL